MTKQMGSKKYSASSTAKTTDEVCSELPDEFDSELLSIPSISSDKLGEIIEYSTKGYITEDQISDVIGENTGATIVNSFYDTLKELDNDVAEEYFESSGGPNFSDEQEEDTYENASTLGFNDAALAQYLKDIGAYELLTAEQEASLAKRIQDGDEYAKDELVNSNLRLVVSIAKKYVNHGMSLLDLIQEGNIGLMTAAEKYDASHGTRFSTYATTWINKQISIGIAQKSHQIYIPISVQRELVRMRKVIEYLSSTLHRNPTVCEISEYMKISPGKVNELCSIVGDPLSFDISVGSTDIKLEDVIGISVEDAYNEVYSSEMRNELKAIMDETLTKEEKLIMTMKYGLDGKPPRTSKAIAAYLNKEFSSVRYTETVAKNKLSRKNKLKNLA